MGFPLLMNVSRTKRRRLLVYSIQTRLAVFIPLMYNKCKRYFWVKGGTLLSSVFACFSNNYTVESYGHYCG